MSFSEVKQNLQFLTIQRYTLLQMGIDLNAMKGKELLKNYGKFIFLITVVLYLEYGLLNFAISLNIDMITGALSMFNQTILILVKICTFLYKGDDFIKLIWEMNDLAENANPKEYKKWLLENRRSELISKIYNYSCWTAVGSVAILPIFNMSYDYYNGNEVKLQLTFGGKFPYDNGGLLHYIIHFVLTMIYVFALLNMTVSLDTLYGWYIYNISAHFRILRVKFGDVALKLENGDNRNFTQDIGSIVCYHNKILQFVKDLNSIFGYILWAEVMLSCLQICFILYTLNTNAHISDVTFQSLVFICIIIQLIIYCFGGEKIKTENELLCTDIYLQFSWHKMSVKEKKLMLLPIMRSQRPSYLRGLFFEVDRSLLVYIVKTAFSFNALLSAMKE